jgi:hypothetical protein
MISRLYNAFLLQDRENVETIAAYLGEGKYDGLDTPEKRALFMVGFTHPELSSGIFLNSDTEQEKFLSLDVAAGTENDGYYMTLGKCLSRRR